jgi:hypothetical protein
MSAIAPFAASSFAPEERPQQVPATADQPRRTGRHEPIRSSTPRIAARGAVLGLTMAAGVASGANYLEHDPQLALLAGAQVGSVAAGTPGDEAAARLLALRGADRVALSQAARQAAGNPDSGRALGLLGRVAVLRALL